MAMKVYAVCFIETSVIQMYSKRILVGVKHKCHPGCGVAFVVRVEG
jgi:hypothetical protein